MAKLTHIEQVSTDTCHTDYKVTYAGQEYDLELWIIVGGTPAIRVERRYIPEGGSRSERACAQSRRFEPTPEVRTKWDAWDKTRKGKRARMGCHPHQDPDSPQGPTIEGVLPNGLEDVKAYLDDVLPELEEHIAGAKERARWEVFCTRHRLPPRHKWPERETEEQPRVVPGHVHRDGRIVFWANHLRPALKGLLQRDAVQFLGVTISPTVLRQVATVFGATPLEAWVEDGELHLEPQDPPVQHLRFLDGAGDKYLGQNGYNAVLEVRAA